MTLKRGINPNKRCQTLTINFTTKELEELNEGASMFYNLTFSKLGRLRNTFIRNAIKEFILKNKEVV